MTFPLNTESNSSNFDTQKLFNAFDNLPLGGPVADQAKEVLVQQLGPDAFLLPFVTEAARLGLSKDSAVVPPIDGSRVALPDELDGFILSSETWARSAKTRFQRLTENFKRFSNWLLRRPYSAPLDRLEIAFAMSLFETADKDILKKLAGKKAVGKSGQEFEINLTDSLKVWHRFFKDLHKNLEGDQLTAFENTCILENISDLLKYQKSIDKLCKKNLRGSRKKGQGKLQERILARAGELQPGQKILIPGGYVQGLTASEPATGAVFSFGDKAHEILETNEDDSKKMILLKKAAFLVTAYGATKGAKATQQLTGGQAVGPQVAPMIYELERTVDGYSIRVFSQDNKIENSIAAALQSLLIESDKDKIDTTELKVDISAEELDDFVENSIKARVAPMSLLNKLDSIPNLVKHFILGNTEDIAFNPRDILTDKLQLPLEQIEPIQLKVNDFKVMKVYIDRVPERNTEYDQMMKGALLLSIYSQAAKRRIDGTSYLSDLAVRNWLRDNAKALCNEMYKKNVEIQSITDALKGMLDDLNGLDHEERVLIPSSPLRQSRKRMHFGRTKIATQVTPKSKVKVTKNSRLRADMPLAPIENLEDFEKGVLSVERLVNRNKCWQANEKLGDLFTVVTAYLEGNLWPGTDLTPKQLTELSNLTERLSEVVIRNNYLMGRIAPSQNYIRYMTQVLAVQSHIARINAPKASSRMMTQFDKFDPNATPTETPSKLHSGLPNPGTMHFMLQSAYLHYGLEAKLIEESLSQINPKKEEIGNLATQTGPSDREDRYENLMEADRIGNTGGKTSNMIRDDYGQLDILPEEITNLKKSYLLWKMMIAPWAIRENSTLFSLGQAGRQAGLGFGGIITEKFEISDKKKEKFEDKLQDFASAPVRRVYQQLLSGKGRIKFNIDEIPDAKAGIKSMNPLALNMDYVLGNISPWGLWINADNWIDKLKTTGDNALYADNFLRAMKGKGSTRHTLDLLFLNNVYEARFAQFILGSKNDPSLITDGYSFSSPIKPVFGGSDKKQLEVTNENKLLCGLPSDIVKELRLANTAKNTRVKETFGKLIKHCHLLQLEPAGGLLFRYFSRNLFAKSALLTEFRRNDHDFALAFTGQLSRAMEEMLEQNKIRAYLYLLHIALTAKENLSIIADETSVEDRPQSVNEALTTLTRICTDAEGHIDGLCAAADGGDKLQGGDQALLHTYRLLRYAQEYSTALHSSMEGFIPQDEEATNLLINIFTSRIRLKTIPLPQTVRETNLEDPVNYLIYRLRPMIQEQLSDAESRNSFCRALLENVHTGLGDDEATEWQWSTRSPLVARSDRYKIDFSTGELWIDNQRLCQLPGAVTANPDFVKIQQMIKNSGFDQNLEEVQTVAKQVKIGKKQGQQYAFSLTRAGRQHAFRAVLDENNRLLFYRKKHLAPLLERVFPFLSRWELYVPQLQDGSTDSLTKSVKSIFTGKEPTEAIIKMLADYNCWAIGKGSTLYAEKDGVVEFVVHLKKGRIKQVVNKQTGARVLQPWSSKRFDVFRRIDDAHNIVAEGKHRKINRLRYVNLPLEFRWNKKEKYWASPQHEGYYLSGRPLVECYGEESTISRLFDGFQHFQLLESDTKLPKVVVSCTEYRKPGSILDKYLDKGLDKNYTTKTQPNYSETKKSQLFTYTMHPTKGLQTEQIPEGYLYLSYILMRQNNLADAVRYLNKADLRQKNSELTEQILDWIKNASNLNTPEMKAFRLHLLHYRIQQARSVNDQQEQQELDKLIIDTTIARKTYLGLLDKGIIPRELHLTNEQLADLDGFLFGAPEIIAILNDMKEQGIDFQEVNNLLNERDPKSIFDYFQKVVLGKNDDGKGLNMLKDVLNGKYGAFNYQDIAMLRELFLVLQDTHKNQVRQQDQKQDQKRAQELAVFSETIKKVKLHFQTRTYREALPTIPVDENDKAPQKAAEAPQKLFSDQDFPNIEGLFTITPGKNEAKEAWNERVEQFKGVISKLNGDDGDEYALEIGEELAEDLKHVVDTASAGAEAFLPQDNIQTLEEDVVQLKGNLENTIINRKRGILERLPALTHENEKKLSLEVIDRINRRDLAWNDLYFDTALRCFGENDWEPLRRLFSNPDDFHQNEIEEYVKNYLKSSIKLGMVRKAETMLADLKKMDEQDSNYRQKSQEIYDLLNVSWHIDTENDPDSRAFLLLEHELELVGRRSQVEVVRELLNNPKLFKQEACGGGKTTYLRNVIAHWHAQKGKLAGVSTLEPLRGIHGPLFAKTTLQAFNEHVYNFYFRRESKSDEVSLMQIQYNLYKAVAQKGRFDYTKKDILSFKLTQTLKHEQVYQERRKGQPDLELIAKLHRELDLMDEIFDLFKKRGTINADELDVEGDARKQQNYAHGDKIGLCDERIDASLDLMELILNKESLLGFRNAISQNQSLNEEECMVHLRVLAEELFDLYNNPEEGEGLGIPNDQREIFVQYMTEERPEGIEEDQFFENINKFFNAYIRPADIAQGEEKTPLQLLKEKACYAHELISSTILGLASKKGGVAFARSEDGVHVIPCEGSAKPNEGSEHCSESEKIWAAIRDYCDTSREGVTANQIQVMVLNRQQVAHKQLKKLRQREPNNPNYAGIGGLNHTKVGLSFRELYGIPLSNINSSSYEEIARRISEDGTLLRNFLKDYVFPEYKQRSEKIVSDSQDPPEIFNSFSGSAGTDSTRRALPDAVDTSNARQKGVYGKIIKSLIEIGKSRNDKGLGSFLNFENQGTLLTTLAQNMQGGDCLVDAGRSFPGIQPVAIAHSLQEALKAQGKGHLVIRYMDMGDRWQMLMDGVSKPVDPSIPLDRIVTIFDDVHTRGAERVSMEGVTEYLTLDNDTDWDRFVQAVLRERGVNKGSGDAHHAEVVYLLPPSVQAKLPKNPTVDDLIVFVCMNSSASGKKNNLKAETARTKAIGRQQMDKLLRRAGKQARTAQSEQMAFNIASGQGLELNKSLKTYRIREKLFEAARGVYIKPIKSNPAAAGIPQGKISSEELLTQTVDAELATFNTIKNEIDPVLPKSAKFTALLNEWEDKLNAKKKTESTIGSSPYKPRVDDKYLPKVNAAGQTDLGNEEEVEVEAEQDQEVEVEAEKENENENEQQMDDGDNSRYLQHLDINWKNYEPRDFLVFCNNPKNAYKKFGFKDHASDRNGFRYTPIIHPLKSLTSTAQTEHIFTTESLFPFSRQNGALNVHETYNEKIAMPSFLGGKKKKKKEKADTIATAWNVLNKTMPKDQPILSRVLVIYDPNTTNHAVIVPSLMDNEISLESYVRKHKGAQGVILFMYNLDSKSIDTNFERAQEIPEDSLRAIKKTLIPVNIQNGEIRYPPTATPKNPDGDPLNEEFLPLCEWLEEASKKIPVKKHEDPLKVMEKGILNFLKAYRPAKRVEYKNSELYKAFRTVEKRRNVTV